MPTVRTEGNASFNIDVSYKLIETGSANEKPLIIYLHGYKQNLQYFEKKCSDLLSLEAYYLFIDGPYPIYDEKHKRKIAQWGRAWYLYDGEQDQFMKSLEKTSIFLQALIDKVQADLNVSRISVIGYSMGGYLAGYFALSHSDFVDDLVVMGGRIKSEKFAGQSFDGMNVLHLHGINDKSVSSERAKQSCAELRAMGASVIFKELNTGHKLTNVYINAVKDWFIKHKIAGLN